jgi:predicted nicotinamide N-methyase
METRERLIHVAGRAIRLRGPAVPERLLEGIDPAAIGREEPIPYWAELWPSAIGLARFLLERTPPGLAGASVLELGAGLGLGGIAAALAGAREVTFTDYFPEALAAATHNAKRNGVRSFDVRVLDWRAPVLPRRYPVVIGSDLLYEERSRAPLVETLAAALEAGGAAWIADPGRPAAVGFEGEAAERGLRVELVATEEVPPARVRILRLRTKGDRG